MLSNVFVKTLRDMRWAILAWALGLAALGALIVSVYAGIPQQERLLLDQLISSLPKGFLGEIESLATLNGFLSFRMFSFFPLVLSVFTVTEASAAVAREEDRRTMDLLLSYPLSRWRAVLEKFTALVVAVLAIALVTAVGIEIAVAATGFDLPVLRVFGAVFNGAAFALLTGCIALFVSCLVGGRMTSAMVAAVFAVASYFLNTLGTQITALEPYRVLSISYHYSASKPLTGEMAWGNLALLFGLTVALIAGSVLAFHRRDVAAGSGASWLPWPRTGNGPLARLSRGLLLRSVFLKTLRDASGGMLGWGISLGILGGAYLALYPAFKESLRLDELLNRLPPVARVFIGESVSFGTPEGFLSLALLTYLPVLLAVYAVIQGASLIANEENGDTLDLLLSQPVPRWRVVVEKAGAMVVGQLVVAAIIVLGLALSWRATGIALSDGRVAEAVLNAVPPALVMGSLAFAVTCLLSGGRFAGGLAAAVTVGSYFVNNLAQMVDWLEPFRSFSVFYYYDRSRPLTSGVDAGSVALLLSVALGLFLVAVVVFQRRDIAT